MGQPSWSVLRQCSLYPFDQASVLLREYRAEIEFKAGARDEANNRRGSLSKSGGEIGESNGCLLYTSDAADE